MSKQQIAMCKWLGDGEIDVELMVRLGVTSIENVERTCRALIDSPWYTEQPQ